MKKKSWTAGLLPLLLCTLLLLSLSGCGDQSNSKENTFIDMDKLAQQLQEEIPFQDQMSQVDSDVFFMLYGLSEEAVDSAVLISSTGATAEEIAIIHASASDQREIIKTAVSDRLAAQRDGFENYVPAELDKLKNPVIIQIGDYIILCVCDDKDKAETIINEYQ